MEDAALISGVKWIVGTLLTILTLFGINKLAENRQKRKYELQNKRAALDEINDGLHATNQGKRIDADQAAFAATDKRLATVEAKCDALQVELRQIMSDNSRLTTENEYLRRDNERHLEQAAKDRERIRYLEDEVTALKVQIQILTKWQTVSDEKGIHTTENPLNVRLIDEGDKK